MLFYKTSWFSHPHTTRLLHAPKHWKSLSLPPTEHEGDSLNSLTQLTHWTTVEQNSVMTKRFWFKHWPSEKRWCWWILVMMKRFTHSNTDPPNMGGMTHGHDWKICWFKHWSIEHDWNESHSRARDSPIQTDSLNTKLNESQAWPKGSLIRTLICWAEERISVMTKSLAESNTDSLNRGANLGHCKKDSLIQTQPYWTEERIMAKICLKAT